jgi:class 3 adenylate cyclase
MSIIKEILMKQSTFKFINKASYPKNAVALIYDLEGFSKFFNQPDVQDYVPIFLNYVSETMNLIFNGGKYYWSKDSSTKVNPLGVEIVHEKFLGDGALYIIMPPKRTNDFPEDTLQYLCNRLWNLKDNFDKVIQKSLEQVPVLDVPQKIRFGISRGSVYELKKSSTTVKEHIGFCVNLASRLQSYCPELGFIASARLMLKDSDLNKQGYIKVIATKIKGFPNEIVIVDKDEFEYLEDFTKENLFQEL